MDYYVENHSFKTPLINTNFHSYKGKSQMAVCHVHDYIELLYCTCGELYITMGEREMFFTQNDLAVIPSNEIHQVYSLSEEDNSYIVIQFRPELISSYALQINEYKYLLPFTMPKNNYPRILHIDEITSPNISRAPRIILDEYRNCSYGYELALYAQVFNLIKYILRIWHSFDSESPLTITQEQTNRIKDVLEYVNENYATNITVKNMAGRCFVSYSYFSRLFTAAVGKPFIKYLNDVRLVHAERLLVKTDKTITEIAFDVGFTDAGYFTRIFKRSNGITPMEYRAKYSE